MSVGFLGTSAARKKGHSLSLPGVEVLHGLTNQLDSSPWLSLLFLFTAFVGTFSERALAY